MSFLMKKTIFSLCCIILATWVTWAGTGTENDPLTVTQMRSKSESSTTKYWVQGYVVGEFNSYANGKYFYNMAPPFNGTGSYVYLIADSQDEFELANVMCIQFPTSAGLDTLNLQENPQYWRKQIKVYGTRESYNMLPGIKKIEGNAYFVSPRPFANECEDWSFYEDFENDAYTPYNTSSMFAGGLYTNEDGVNWEFKGATIGNTSNDNKWESTAARIRWTEATSGEKGHIQMMFNKPNGAGEVRFWAGNYKDDSAQQLAIKLEISTNNGTNWIVKSDETAIKRGSNLVTNGMSEYRFVVNESGNIRIRISKADNNTGSINLDNLRVSDFDGTSAIEPITKQPLFIYTNHNGVYVVIENEPCIIEIYNLAGQICKQTLPAIGTQFIPLQSGVYFVKAGNKTAKIVL